MKLQTKIAGLLAALALATVPAMALADPPSTHGQGTKAANNEKLAPGQACKGMSRKHVKGQKGTPFSRCVVAAAKLKHDAQES